jgi:ribosomal small subunit protein bTHX
MGKGDIKSKKGKITKGSFGNSRKHKSPKNKGVNKPASAPKNSSTAGPIAPAPAAAIPPTPET